MKEKMKKETFKREKGDKGKVEMVKKKNLLGFVLIKKSLKKIKIQSTKEGKLNIRTKGETF